MEQEDPHLGRSFGPYLVTDRLADGRSGRVYRAQHVPLGHVVALKILRREIFPDRATAQRYVHACNLAELRDAELFVRVVHAELTEYGEVWVAIDLCEGRRLDELLKEGPLPPERAARLVHRVALAVATLHRRGRAHGGLEGRKIMVEGDRTRLLEHELSDVLGLLPQEANFVAPERSPGLPATPVADVYAIGVLLRQALTGSTDATQPLPDADGLGPLVAEWTARDPAQRPVTALAVAAALERLPFDLGGLVSERPKRNKRKESTRPGAKHQIAGLASGRPMPGEPAPASQARPPRRSFQLFALLGAMVVAVIAGVALLRAWTSESVGPEVAQAEGPPDPGSRSHGGALISPARPNALDAGSAAGTDAVAPAALRFDAAARDSGKKLIPDAGAKSKSRRDAALDAPDSGSLFTELDMILGRELASRGLNWDDLEAIDPARTKQWGRWYRQAARPSDSELQAQFEALKKSVARAGESGARNTPTATRAR